jgi:hypothetical protein
MDPVTGLLGGAVELRRPFDESLAALDDRRVIRIVAT